MAVFKTLNAKKKEYVFDFLGNRGDPRPARAVFSRFPLPGETFAPNPWTGIFDGVDKGKVAQRDAQELEKLSRAFIANLSPGIVKIDLDAFVRECIDRFEDFRFVNEDGRTLEIRTADDFLGINRQAMAAIALDCYKYARQEDEFAMGE
jgi:hypothetical protein